MTEHEAGRKLDVLIAERIMGLCLHTPEPLPVAVETARRRKRFLEEYGQEAPGGWDGGAYDESQWDYDHWPLWCPKCGRENLPYRSGVPLAYSTTIAAAWLVVEKLDRPFEIINFKHEGRWRWSVSFYRDDLFDYTAEADTAPLAICRAALKALEGGEA